MKAKRLASPVIPIKFINVVYTNGETMVKPCRGWTDEEVERTRAVYERFTDCVRAYVS